MSNRPWLRDADVTLYHGDILAVLPELEAESVDCVVCSPPYWGLRSYLDNEHGDKPLELGLEKTPEQYVERMVEVFREVRRVLAPNGTVWCNLGDSFQDKQLVGVPWRVAFALQADGWYLRSDIIWAKPNPMPESVTDRPTKAHEYVFLLSKQPRYFFDQEAVRESHTSTRWGGPTITQPPTTKYAEATADGFNGAAEALSRPGREWNAYPSGGRNIRSVWEIATQPYPDAHFATFPEELARRCIAAGCPEQVCRVCGKARERITEKVGDAEYHDRWGRPLQRVGQRHYTKDGDSKVHVQTSTGVPTGLGSSIYETRGWTECSCHTRSWEHSDACAWHEGEPCTCKEFKEQDPKLEHSSQSSSSKYRPGIVLDPFMGSGTVAHVARKLGRHAVGIDLNASYLRLAAKRLAQQSLFAEVASGL